MAVLMTASKGLHFLSLPGFDRTNGAVSALNLPGVESGLVVPVRAFVSEDLPGPSYYEERIVRPEFDPTLEYDPAFANFISKPENRQDQPHS